MNVTNDFIHDRTGYKITELYIPYYNLHINVSQGFNVFLESPYGRYKAPPIETVTVPPEMAERIYNSAKELICNRPTLKDYVTSILKPTEDYQSSD